MSLFIIYFSYYYFFFFLQKPEKVSTNGLVPTPKENREKVATAPKAPQSSTNGANVSPKKAKPAVPKITTSGATKPKKVTNGASSKSQEKEQERGKCRLLQYRVAQKNGTAYFPQYVDAITNIVYEVASPEKNDTKITNFGSVVCFLGHIL